MADPNSSGEKSAPIIDSTLDSGKREKYEPQVSMENPNVGKNNLMSNIVEKPSGSMQLPQEKKPGLVSRIKQMFTRPKTQAVPITTQEGMSRRRFLQTGAAVGGVALAGGTLAAAEKIFSNPNESSLQSPSSPVVNEPGNQAPGAIVRNEMQNAQATSEAIKDNIEKTTYAGGAPTPTLSTDSLKNAPFVENATPEPTPTRDPKYNALSEKTYYKVIPPVQTANAVSATRQAEINVQPSETPTLSAEEPTK